MKFAKRMSRIATSASALMSQKAREMKANGIDVIALSSGQPDFPTPEHIIEAAMQAALRGETKYTTISGSNELKDVIVSKFRKENNLDYTPTEIIIGNGSKQVIYNAFIAGTENGGEVIMPAPYYVAYIDMIKFSGGIPVIIPCTAKQSFKLTAEQLESAITPNTQWLLLNSPNNPTGAVYTPVELQELSEVLLRYPHVKILMDDIYEHITFDGLIFTTLTNIAPQLKERTVIANGVSKSYAMTGWRVGYAAAPSEMIQQMTKLQSLVTSGASSISQAAAIAALTGPQDFIETRAKSFETRRDLVVNMINQADGLSCHSPKGAFYVYPSCAGIIGKKTPSGNIIETDRDFVVYLLETQNVATVHGEAYGLSPHFRISYASSLDELREACKRIQIACSSLR
ncbi:MAG: aspartate aminotransferase [Rhodospirillaceae bacterium]|nr:aspartate aminotransferase [Rhodospirillaceae bacterium]